MNLPFILGAVRKPRILLTIAAGILIVGAILAQVAKGDGPDPELPTPTGSMPDQQTVFANATRTAAGEEADEQALLDARNGLLGTPQPKNGSFTPADIPSYSDPPASTGIDDGPSLPSGWGAQYLITNEWYGIVSGQKVVVDAGSRADDPTTGLWNNPEQGVLIVRSNGNGDYLTQNGNGEYLTPTRSGRVRITLANGTCLTVVSTQNNFGAPSSGTFHFDVATRTWSCPTLPEDDP